MSRGRCLERYKINWEESQTPLNHQTENPKTQTDKYIPLDTQLPSYQTSCNEKMEGQYYDKERAEFESLDEFKLQKTRSTFSIFKKTLIATTTALALYTISASTTFYQPAQFFTTVVEPKFNVSEVTELYLNVLKSSNLAGDWSKKYTAEPHLAGTNYPLVQFTADKFAEYGFDATIDAFETYINYPKNESFLTLNENGEVIYKPTLVEDVLEDDESTSGDDLIPAFHGYSANGNVTAEYIFANYGSIEDFRLLEAKGVNVSGKIAVVRYGKLFRGLKVKHAQEAGAVGVLIYSDPADDYVDEDEVPYPEGPGRNPSSIQRGSVQFLSSLPGDPTRFLEDKSPEALKNLTTIPKIPSLPISYKEVAPILAKLNGHGLDLGFKGGIGGFDYSVGPAPSVELNIYNNNDYVFTDLYNVIGLYEGTEPENVIVIGNHRDAWIKGGAADPNSGSAVLLEIARALGELFKLGFKPRYSILLASWDGEEYALLGSTSYAERYAKVLQKKVVAYLNSDVAVGGSHLKLAASPLLNEYLLEVADLVEYPKRDNTYAAPLTLKEHFLNTSHVQILGSGSDYTVFYEHLGITSADIGFNSGKGDPVYHYHSNYDSYHWMSEFADPGFKLHNAAAQYLGLLALRLSEPKTLAGFKATDFATAIKGYFYELKDKIPVEWLNREIPSVDHIKSFCHMRAQGSAPEAPSSFDDLITLTSAELINFVSTASALDVKLSDLQSQWDTASTSAWRKFYLNWKIFYANKKLKHLEQSFLYKSGLKNREWFKHIGFASGRFTGYAGQTLPGLTEALEDRDFEEAVKWVHVIKKSVETAGLNLA